MTKLSFTLFRASPRPLIAALVLGIAPGLTAAIPGGQCNVYSNQPPAIAGVDFKPATIHQTEFSRLGALNVSVAIGEESSVKRSRSSGYRSSSSGRYEETQLHVRVQLRSTDEKQASGNISVMVQYFVRAVRDSVPRQHSATIAKLDQLGSKFVTVQFPPRSFYSSVYEQYTSRSGRSRHDSGEEFCGILVSVIDASDAVLYQATSNSALDDFGRTTIGEFRRDRGEAEQETAQREFEIARKDFESRRSDPVAKARFNAAKQRVDKLRPKRPK